MRLQIIETALIGINDTVFQELCDSFLKLRNHNYIAFARSGSKSGKQKAIKGTPDSFFLLPNGKFIFVEHSTNISEGFKKLHNDILKCLDESKTGIPVDDLIEIIICINFNISPEEIKTLNDLTAAQGVAFTLHMLDNLAIELNLQHRDLCYEYLKLPLDTGQIVSMERFIKEYNQKSNGIATTLDNTFLYREAELDQFKNALDSHDFVILSGPAGVGKTKLALESIGNYLEDHKDYGAYCVSYKSHVLLDDLYYYLNPDGNFILFVDDANRIDAFGQITGFFNNLRKGKLKVIITVRDYAVQEITKQCYDFSPFTIFLNRFPDEHITGIVAAEPFKILNHRFQREIVRIADGNPRLAIMTALLAIAKQNLNALHDVSEMFESYFGKFAMDNAELANPTYIKCLGLISFFHTLPYANRELMLEILSHFEIDYSVFLEVIDNLDRLEMIELQYEHVKIPEQNLATYFFYKAVLKDKLISFPILLNEYFSKFPARFKDSVVSANNTFGYNNVMEKLLPDLKDYFHSVKDLECKAEKFLSAFWFYLQQETLDYVYSRTLILADQPEPEFDLKDAWISVPYTPKDEILSILSEYLWFNNQLSDVIELSLEYCRKKPELASKLARNLLDRLLFDENDELFDYARQHLLFDVLIKGLKEGDLLASQLFYHLAPSFLTLSYRHTKAGRNSSIIWYEYHIQDEAPIHDLRSKIWQAIDQHFDFDPEGALLCIEASFQQHIEGDTKIIAHDFLFVAAIVKSHLDPNNFRHCKCVEGVVRWSRKENVQNDSLAELETRFNNPTFIQFRKLNWDRIRDRESYEFEDYRQYDVIKEADIRSNFKLKNENDARDFVIHFVAITQLSANTHSYTRALDIVIDETLTSNFKLGLFLLQLVMKTANSFHYFPRYVFATHLKNAKTANEIFSAITAETFEGKQGWLLTYFDYLDDSLVDETSTARLEEQFHNLNGNITVFLNNYERYTNVEPRLFTKLLELVLTKNKLPGNRIQIWSDLFTTYFRHVESSLELAKKTYIQQEGVQSSFDYDCEGLLTLLKKEPAFIEQYVLGMIEDDQHTIYGVSKTLSVVWQIPDIEKHLITAFDAIIKSNLYFGGTEHYCNAFFRNLKADAKPRARKFLENYLIQNAHDIPKVKVVVDISRHAMREHFEDFLLLFLAHNQDVSAFRSISWRGSFTSGSGDTILADVEMADWKRIENIVAKSSEGIKLLPIKKYISDVIDGCQRKGNWERQRKFITGY